MGDKLLTLSIIVVIVLIGAVLYLSNKPPKHQEPELIPYEVPERGNEDWEGYECEISDLRGGELKDNNFIARNPRHGCNFIVTYTKDPVTRSVPISMMCDEQKDYCGEEIKCVCE